MKPAYREAAVRLVREGGIIAKDMIRRIDIRTDKGQGDFVTTADLRVEAHILRQLEEAFPDHGFFSEERGGARTDAAYVWVLDPIDGTKHYVRGNPMYSVSLALVREGVSVLGVVYIPEIEQLYVAERDAGATLNGRPLHVATETALERSMPCVEIPSRHAGEAEKRWAFDRLEALIRGTQRVRIVGVSSIGLCLTAAGAFDAYVNLGSGWQPHDVAAARLVMREAGGRYETAGQRIVAGPEALCERLASLIGFVPE